MELAVELELEGYRQGLRDAARHLRAHGHKISPTMIAADLDNGTVEKWADELLEEAAS